MQGTEEPAAATARAERLQRSSDHRLATRAGLGDRAAFEELFGRHFDATVRFAVPMLDGDRQLAEDAVQDAWTKVWITLPGFRGTSAVRTWVFSIVARSALDVRRRRRPVPYDDRLLEPMVDRSATADGPEESYESLELWQTLQRALEELPWNQRACWLLRETEGLSYDEIARALGLTPTVVRGQLHRARRALVTRMEQWR